MRFVDLLNEADVTIGINIRNERGYKWADLVIDGKKYYETRNSNSLKPYIGKRVGVVRTGEGKAMVIGEVTVGQPLHITSKEDFDRLRHKHLVPDTSKFKFGKEKYLYPMISPVRYDEEYPVTSRGIISRKL